MLLDSPETVDGRNWQQKSSKKAPFKAAVEAIDVDEK